MTTQQDFATLDKTFVGTFRFVAVGGKISTDVKGSEKELADYLRECGEEWIAEHTNGRCSALGEVSVAYIYGWGPPSVSPTPRKRIRKAV